MIKSLPAFLTSEEPRHIRLRQYSLAGLAFLLVFGLLVAVVFFFEAPVQTQSRTPESTAQEIASGGSRLKAEEMWRFQMEDDSKKLREAVQELKTVLETTRKDQESQTQRSSYEQKLEQTIEDLQDQIKSKLIPSESERESQSSALSSSPTFSAPGRVAPGTSSLIQKFTFPRSLEEAPLMKTVKNTVPAGAFVRSVLLSGLDASASMSAASDPRPMLLRMVDHGTLPRSFKSDLKDCHMTAGAYGDLSSERIYARLEKLTCTVRKTGEIIETQVAGYIAGPDGKAGIRGLVVSKEAAFLERSLMGGLIGGLANVMSPQNRQSLVNPFSAGNPKVDAPSTKEMFQSGMAEGTSNALDRLSQYYINRAEQLQPVIQVGAGQVVDVVFTEGVAFGSQGVKEKIAQGRQSQNTAPEPSYGSSAQSSSSAGETSSSAPQTFPTGD